MGKFKKKPVVIEAIKYIGPDNCAEVHEFLDIPHDENACGTEIYIETIEGVMECPIGWWVIKGVEGEFYPCKDSIFKESYEQVDW